MIRRKPMLEQANSLLDCQLVLASLMLHLPGHVYWKDSQGIYLGCNDRQAQSLGLTFGEEVIGKTDFELPWQAELASRFWENDRQVLLTGVSKTVEELALVDGKEAVVWSLKVPLKTSSDTIVGLLGISLDITQQKKVEAKLIQAKEAAEAAVQAKTRFLDNIRHDIRTPISGIQGCTQAISDCLNQQNLAQAKEYLQDLDTSTKALLKLLNQVLASLRVAHGLALKKERFDLKQVIVPILKLNQARAKQKGLRMHLRHDEAIPVLVGDRAWIGQIVLELVTNALNFTDQGEVKVMTQLASKKGDRVIIKIAVEDTGCGIPLNKQQGLFTGLSHLHPAYSGPAMGTGFGLSLIKQAIDQLEGEIYVESSPESGSKFTCVLPLKVALLKGKPEIILDQTSVDQSLAEEKQIASRREQPISVLLVEDDCIIRKIMVVLLTKLNCQVAVAVDAHSALRMAKESSYELIFLDIGLPDGSGNEVAANIRHDEQGHNQATPMVAVSAHVDGKSKKACQQAGINAVLSKPLSEETARAVIELFVRGC